MQNGCGRREEKKIFSSGEKGVMRATISENLVEGSFRRPRGCEDGERQTRLGGRWEKEYKKRRARQGEQRAWRPTETDGGYLGVGWPHAGEGVYLLSASCLVGVESQH